MEHFSFEDIERFVAQLELPVPLAKARVWPGDDRSVSWAVECHDLDEFCSLVAQITPRVRFMAYDEALLDDETLQNIQDDLYRIADEGSLSFELVSKAISALRGHEGELYAVQCFAFLDSGPAICCRSQTPLARFIYSPERLLNSESLTQVRKLKTLHEV